MEEFISAALPWLLMGIALAILTVNCSVEKKKGMRIGLAAAAVLLFCVILFWVIPAKERKQKEYEARQQDALTHDITSIEDYRTPYIGDAVNATQLFAKLPLGKVEKKYEIDSENGILTVSYLDTVWNIGESKVQQDLFYNTVATMASIDNLDGITYKFSGDSFSFTREQIEAIFGKDLSNLLEKEIWEEEVQSKIADRDFLTQFY